jgi:hypothetical protein
MGPTSVAEVVWEVLVKSGNPTRWLRSRLARGDPGGLRVRVGGGSVLEVGVLVLERNFTKFSGERAYDDFGKRHESSLRFGIMVRWRRKEPTPSAVQTQEPKTKVSPWLKATVGLMRIEAVEFTMRSSARSPTWHTSCQCFRSATYQGEYPR